MKLLLFITLFIIISKCSNQIANEFEHVYELRNDAHGYLGDVFIRLINDSTFNSLLIINQEQTEADTLYKIDNHILINRKGIDGTVLEEGFWGYRFEIKRDDYFVLVALHNDGQNVSDPITIEWNPETECFESLKVK